MQDLGKFLVCRGLAATPPIYESAWPKLVREEPLRVRWIEMPERYGPVIIKFSILSQLVSQSHCGLALFAGGSVAQNLPQSECKIEHLLWCDAAGTRQSRRCEIAFPSPERNN
ncbi:hypothetical protein BT63DRAFT_450317 [Microthyrium microscopicum]|uniref:Uncharacterized protein n=1 Tax=Microthyrium microscopicum TaxID=703497 RepID=A0A6A6UU81_9PEZI|nr:hypothetical protein BT63DRAFT_450317 [Microthyrium microscopicum]